LPPLPLLLPVARRCRQLPLRHHPPKGSFGQGLRYSRAEFADLRQGVLYKPAPALDQGRGAKELIA